MDNHLVQTSVWNQIDAMQAWNNQNSVEFQNVQDSELENKGKETFEDGSSYMGQWKGQDRHGYGRMWWLDGSQY